MVDLIGHIFGQYEIISQVGSGTISTVYLAQHTVTKRHVAIKVFDRGLTEGLIKYGGFDERFKQKIQTFIGLDHPHIVKLFEHGQQELYRFIVMEFMTGGNLADRLRHGLLPLPMVVHIVNQIASALDYCHERSLIHTYLYPLNILFDAQGNVQLADLGLKTVVSESIAISRLRRDIMWENIAMVPYAYLVYLAPEAWSGGPTDAHTDIYTLGVLTFEMLTGQVPFIDESSLGLMRKTFGQAPPSVASLRPDISSSVNEVIQKAMAKNKTDRFPSAGQFGAGLRLAALGLI